MWEFFTQALEHGGLVGMSLAGCFTLFILAAKMLWTTNQELHKEIFLLHKEVTALQEKRVEEAKEVSETIIDMSRDLEKAIDHINATMNAFIEIRCKGTGR